MDAFEHSLLRSEYDYIVLQNPLRFHYPDHPESLDLKTLYLFIEENQAEFNQRYKIIKEFELPELSEAVVYRSRNLERAQ